MNNKLTIYSHQINRLSKLERKYEDIAIGREKGKIHPQAAFDACTRIRKLKFDITVDMVNVDK